MWITFGQWKWKTTVADLAQRYDMKNPANYGLSLEEVLHKNYAEYKWPVKKEKEGTFRVWIANQQRWIEKVPVQEAQVYAEDGYRVQRMDLPFTTPPTELGDLAIVQTPTARDIYGF